MIWQSIDLENLQELSGCRDTFQSPVKRLNSFLQDVLPKCELPIPIQYHHEYEQNQTDLLLASYHCSLNFSLYEYILYFHWLQHF